MNRHPANRRLSVEMRFYKTVFPWILLLAAVLAVVLMMWSAITGEPRAFEILPLAIVLGVLYLLTRVLGADLADEVLDGGDHLVVRQGEIVEQVPLGEIEAVKESIWQRHGPPRIELVLKTPGKLGRVIAFVPVNYTLMPLTRSPMTYELSDRVERAQREYTEIRSRRKPT